MTRYKLYPAFFFLLALLGGLVAANAQAPQITVGGIYQATPPVLTDKQLAIEQVDINAKRLVTTNAETSLAPGVAPSKAVVGGCLYNATANIATDGQTTALTCDVDGGLKAYAPDIIVTGNITTQNLNLTGTATAGSAISTVLDARAGITIQITGTWTGTLIPQVSTDGANWISMSGATVLQESTGVYISTVPSAATGIFNVMAAGHAQFRITANSAVTGSVGITMRATQPVQFVTTAAVQYPTYDAAVVGLVAQAAATDYACLTTSGGKKLTMAHASVGGTATAATPMDVVLVKRSTVDTGGTAAVATSVPRSSSYAAAGGILTTWTANPAALGTLVGNADAQKIMLVTTAAAVPYMTDNGVVSSAAYTVQGTEALCLNFNGQTIAGNNLDVHFMWSEQ